MSDIDGDIATLRRIRATKAAVGGIIENYDHFVSQLAESGPKELSELERFVSSHIAFIKQLGSDTVLSQYLGKEEEVLERLRAMVGQKLRQSRHSSSYGSYSLTPAQGLDEIDEVNIEAQQQALPVQAIRADAALTSPIQKSTQHPRAYTPTLDDIVDHYRSKGLVGEESTCIVQTLGAMHLMNFGIESLSGSGKSHMAEMLIELLPEGTVYRMGLSSNTAEMYDAEQINRCKIIYIPELQKAMRTTNPNPIMVEVLKSITEGKDATRKVRDQEAGVNRQYTITAGKGVIFTLAIENDFKYDAELSRRVFILYTDVSEEQTERVLHYKAGRRHAAQPERQAEDYRRETALKTHIAQCMGIKFVYENPFAESIAESVPRTIRARSYADYLFGLIEASAKFHHRNRLVEKHAEKSTLFINLEDVHEVYRHYWKQFVMGLLRVPLLAEQALAAFEPGLPMEAQEAYERMKGPASAPSPAYGFQLVKSTLEGLASAGMLEKDDQEARRPMYIKKKELPLEAGIDWEKCFREGADYMRDNYPQLAEKWLGMQAIFLNRVGLYGNG